MQKFDFLHLILALPWRSCKYYLMQICDDSVWNIYFGIQRKIFAHTPVWLHHFVLSTVWSSSLNKFLLLHRELSCHCSVFFNKYICIFYCSRLLSYCTMVAFCLFFCLLFFITLQDLKLTSLYWGFTFIW